MADFVGYINTEDGDLVIENGTFAKGDPMASEVRRILLSRAGDYKFAPAMHVNLQATLGAPTTPAAIRDVERRVRQQLGKDGVTVKAFQITEEGKLNLDANR